MNGSESIDRPLRDFGLWSGIVGPPALWLVQFQTIYMLIYPACGAGRNRNIALTCVAFFVAITCLGIYPLHNWNENRLPQNRVSRTRKFMSILAMMSVAMFLVLVVAQWLAALVLDPCAI